MRIFKLAPFVFLLSAAVSQGATFVADPVHSSVGFNIRHFVTRVPGDFKDYSGTIDYDVNKKEVPVVKFTIKAASIYTGNPDRDKHLRSPDFFNVAKYPDITFESKSGEKKGDNKFVINGDLTMHGVTKPVSFDFEYTGSFPFNGSNKYGFSASTTIDRKDYGIIWNKVADKGSLVLGDDVKITVQLEAKEKTKEEKAKK